MIPGHLDSPKLKSHICNNSLGNYLISNKNTRCRSELGTPAVSTLLDILCARNFIDGVTEISLSPSFVNFHWIYKAFSFFEFHLEIKPVLDESS